MRGDAGGQLVILGSGHLNDFDLPFLQTRFRRITLVDAVHPDAELASAARALGQQLAKGPAQAQARIKALISAAPHHSLLQHLDAERDSMFASGETEDGHEGIRAFIEKRAPKFN